MNAVDPQPVPNFGRSFRRQLLGAGLSFLGLAAVAVVLSVHFKTELSTITAYVFGAIGIYGLVAFLFVSDALISPLPPVSALILIAASPYHQYWRWLIPLLGVMSSVAGCCGYFGGRLLSGSAIAQKFIGNLHGEGQDLVLKYGPGAALVGAFTPVPYSLMCWTAGLVRLPFRAFLLPCILRIPRYMAYYAAVALFPRLFS